MHSVSCKSEFVIFAVCGFFAAASASADCGAVIAAYEKSGNQPKSEMFVGVGPSQPLGTATDSWTGRNPLATIAADLKAAAAKGVSKCAPAGNADYRGSPVVKYRVQPHPASSGKEAHIVWIQKSTGLMVLDEIPDAGMYIAYRYPVEGR